MEAELALSLDFMRHSSSPYDTPELSRQEVSPYFFIFSPIHVLTPVLASPHHLFLEVGKNSALNISLNWLLEKQPDFSLCMTSASAFHANMASAVTHSLKTRFGLTEQQLMSIETCLQETIVNAIVHGNLAIDSTYKSTESLDAYFMLVNKRLSHAPYRYRRVTVCAWEYAHHLMVSVGDQGGGFSLITGKSEEDALPHGRGLRLVRELSNRVWLDENRRTIYMTFNQ